MGGYRLVRLSHYQTLFLGNFQEQLHLYFKVSISVNSEQVRTGERKTERPPGTWAGSLIRAILCVLALVIQMAVLLNKFTFPQTVQLKWVHTVYLTLVIRRVKDFSKPWLKKEGVWEREKASRRKRRATRRDTCRVGALSWRPSAFLSSPINLMPEGRKRRKSTTSNHIC